MQSIREVGTSVRASSRRLPFPDLKRQSRRQSDYLGYFARISASRFLRYASYSALRAGSDGDP